MVILALPEQNNQCMILWELMGNRRTEERDGSEIYLEKNTDKENTYSAKKISLFLRQCEMESEKILNRKSLQHWWRTEPSFWRELWCRKKNLSTVQWSWRTATYHQWPNTYGMKYKLCSVLTAPTLFECWGMTLSCVWPSQSKLQFRGHHHGLHWNNTITALFQRTKEFLGMRWASIALQLPDLMDMATGWRCGITSLLQTVYLLIEVCKYYNPRVGVLFRHWC